MGEGNRVLQNTFYSSMKAKRNDYQATTGHDLHGHLQEMRVLEMFPSPSSLGHWEVALVLFLE